MNRWVWPLMLVAVVLSVAALGTGAAEAHDWDEDDGCRVGWSADGRFYASGTVGDWGIQTSGGMERVLHDDAQRRQRNYPVGAMVSAAGQLRLHPQL